MNLFPQTCKPYDCTLYLGTPTLIDYEHAHDPPDHFGWQKCMGDKQMQQYNIAAIVKLSMIARRRTYPDYYNQLGVDAKKWYSEKLDKASGGSLQF